MTTVQDVMEVLGRMASVQPGGTTVDGLIFGNPLSEVRGIAVAFMASHQAVDQAERLGANLILTHEGLYYSHADSGRQPKDIPVSRMKMERLAEAGMSVYRLHDAIHRTSPDCITEGLIRALGWVDCTIKRTSVASVVYIPQMSVEAVAGHLKERLGISYLRMSGDREAPCRRIGILAGYRGGGGQTIPLMEQEDLDLLVYGEGPEWETPEYVRDAAYQGRGKALLVLGHAESEIPGMRYAAELLREYFPTVPVYDIHMEPVFKVL